MEWWFFVSISSGAYVFVGLVVIFLVAPFGWPAILVAIVAWIANLFLLRHANRKW